MKVLKFYADWCQPCKALSRTIESIGDVGITIENVDIDENSETAVKYGIRGVPTLVLVNDDGSEVRRRSGNMSEKDFKAFVAG